MSKGEDLLLVEDAHVSQLRFHSFSVCQTCYYVSAHAKIGHDPNPITTKDLITLKERVTRESHIANVNEWKMSLAANWMSIEWV